MNSKKQMVLVVEDELINRKIIRKILEEKYDLLEAENGKVGLELCDRYGGSIVAILLDLTMPVMTGYEFMEIIRKGPHSNIPIIVMTGSSDVATEQKALSLGAIDFVPKPYKAGILHLRLQNAIARSKMALFEQIKHISEHDGLTDLYNRTKMFEETRRLLQKNPQQQYAFIRLDIDHFSLYNSSFGELAGDKLLCFFADMLRQTAKATEEKGKGKCVYGRMNADVFTICLPFRGDRAALTENISHGQRLLNEYSKDYALKISAGVNIITAAELEGDGIAECYLKASLAMQKCKNHFDSIIEFYDEDFKKKLDAEMEITNDMQRALTDEEFIVYFQPKYEVVGNSPCGAEALIRWQHPTKGLVSPGTFIPVFESNGFIAKVDYYVWEHTCRRLHKWLQAGRNPKPISVNISRVSLYNRNLDRVLVDLVNKYQVPQSLLELEITESAYMTSPEQMHELVRKLHAAGFKILMDDFGSDYSSLNTLKDIAVDVLKIDMAFVPTGKDVEKGEIILASMIKMAKWLGIGVVCEGVETRRQRDFLEGAGCDVIQGYYYAKPMPPEEYEERYVYSDALYKEATKTLPEIATSVKLDTVLIIDDSELDRSLIKSFLEEYYNIETCSSAEEGLIYLRNNTDKVKLILLDNVMPAMTGMDFLRFCQNSVELHCIPTVMITASELVEDQIEAFENGAYDYISKPLIQEVVVARVRHIMDTTYHYSSYDRVKQEYAATVNREPGTGLFLHQSFRDISNRMLATFPEDPMAMMIIEIDDYEELWTSLGEAQSDELVTKAALEIRREFRKSDILGRLSKESFGVLLCGIPDKKTARQKCAELQSSLAFMGARGFGLDLTASIGLVYPIKGDTIDTIMAKADQALVEAKSGHKGLCVTYGESVPMVVEDDKAIVLVLSSSEAAFKEIAFGYGDTAAFVWAHDYASLQSSFEQYRSRIMVVCVDFNDKIKAESQACCKYCDDQGVGDRVPAVALCSRGDLEQLRMAISHKIGDVVSLPIVPSALQTSLSLLIMKTKRRLRQ